MRGGLVVAQVALSMVLLTGAGLLIRSFVRLRATEMGFPTENILTASITTIPSRYPETGARVRFFESLQADVQAIPDVVSASLVDMVPIRDPHRNWFIWDVDHPPEGDGRRVSTYARTVMPGYFRTLGIPFLRGRDHSLQDSVRAEPFLILNQAAAQAVFPDKDPVGRRVTVFNGAENRDYEVLGVVGNIRANFVWRDPQPQMYFNYVIRPSSSMALTVRSRGDPESLVTPIRQALTALDPEVPLAGLATMDEIISGSLSQNLVLSVATALFAATALLLSLTGLYAVLAFYVAQRTREIGIRVAFGASAGRVLAMVVGRGLLLVAGGLALGLAGAFSSTRILQNQLYQVGATDPVTLGGVALGFVVVGLLASLVPARRATKVDPVRAMQVE